MRQFDFNEFHQNVQQMLSRVENLIMNIQDGRYSLSYSPDEQEMDSELLDELLNQTKLRIFFAYDYLGMTKMTKLLSEELEKYEGKFGRLSEHPIVDVTYSPVQFILQNHLDAITCHIKIEDEEDTKRIFLERILRNTAKILKENSVVPSNEADVRREVLKTLSLVFPYTVREVPIPKVFKTFRPDIGIKELSTAIEYKFVDSENDAKVAIGGIYEDMLGYEGSADWTTFYAVIYMTDHFMTQEQVEAEFKLSKAPHNWKPILVFGKGERERKK